MGDIYDEIDATERSLIDLLIRLNLVTQAQVTEALEFQCRLPRSQYQTLEAILVEMEHISPDTLKQARELSGHELLHERQDRRSQLEQALPHEPQEPEDTRFVSAEALAAALAGGPPQKQDISHLISELPAAKPEWETLFLDQEAPQVAKIQAPEPVSLEPEPAFFASDPEPAPLAPTPSPTPEPLPLAAPPSSGLRAAGAFAQRNLPRAAAGWANPQTRPQLPTAPKPAPPPVADGGPRPQLGEILLKNHDLEEWQLTHALCIQRAAPQSTPKLGTLLVRLGYVQPQAVERALSLQVSR